MTKKIDNNVTPLRSAALRLMSVALFLSVGLILFAQTAFAQVEGGITAEQLNREITAGGKIILINVSDAFDPERFDLGGERYPVSVLTARLPVFVFPGVNRDDKIVVYDQNMGALSQPAIVALSITYSKVRFLIGGTNSWVDSYGEVRPKLGPIPSKNSDQPAGDRFRKDGVSVFTGPQQTGSSGVFGVGTFAENKGTLKPISNDSAVSIYVPPGFRVKLCDSDDVSNNDNRRVEKCEEAAQGRWEIRWSKTTSWIKVWRDANDQVAGSTANSSPKPAVVTPPSKPEPPQPKGPNAPKFVRIYVGHLSADTTEETLRSAFAEFGEVKSVKMGKDGDDNPIGFVEMAAGAADEAIEQLNESELDGNEIVVRKAKPDEGN